VARCKRNDASVIGLLCRDSDERAALRHARSADVCVRLARALDVAGAAAATKRSTQTHGGAA